MKKLLKILIIDDEMVLRNGLKYLCDWEANGFTIAGEASNGTEGFSLISRLNPDIVITDIVMPGMDGIDLTAKIKEYYPQISIVVLSSYDDFSYAKSLFKLGIADYLLKPELEADTLLRLLKRLKPVCGSLTEERSTASQFFQELLTFSSMDDSQCRLEMQERGIRFSPSPFLLLASSCPADLAAHHILPVVAALCAQYLPDSPCISCMTGQGELCLLIQLTSEGTDVSPEQGLPGDGLLMPFIDRIRGQLGVPLLFARSALFMDLGELSAQYEELTRLLSYRFYFPDKKLLHSGMLSSGSLSFPEKAFHKGLLEENFTHSWQLLLSYLQEAQERVCVDVFTLKKQTEYALYTLISALTDAGYSTAKMNADKIRYFKQIDQAPDCDHLSAILDDILAAVKLTLLSGGRERENSLFRQIQEYIAANCEKELRLYDLARQFHLNYTYLSTLFYQNTQEHFSDYLNRIRIEKAKKLLRTEDQSIQSISEQCGFGNQGYFSKIFRKLVGCSPREYQKGRITSVPLPLLPPGCQSEPGKLP